MAIVMEPTRKIVFIPYWIKKILQREGQSLSILQNLNSLSMYLSSEDLAIVATLNASCEKYFGFDLGISENIVDAWAFSADGQSIYQSQIKPMTPLVDKTVTIRLFSEESFDAQHSNPYEIVDAGREMIVVVVYPGHFCGQFLKTNQHKLIAQMLKLFHGYEGTMRMACRPLFETYVRSLSNPLA